MKKKIDNFTENELREIFENANTMKEIVERLGYKPSGHPVKLIREYAKKYNIQLKCDSRIKKSEDMIGEIYNYLKIIDIDKEKSAEKGETFFICKCLKCDSTTLVSRNHLISNHTKSCGCLQKEAAIKNLERITESGKKGHFKDRIGEKYGLLTVIGPDEQKMKETGKSYWLCRCDCNKIVSASAKNLVNGHKKSCGCLSSFGELSVGKELDKNNILYSKEYSFKDLVSDKNIPLRFDFAIFNNNNQLIGLIEYNGEQHYKEVKLFGGEDYFNKLCYHDKIKQNYCMHNNIPLLIIKYDEPIEEKIQAFLKDIK